MWSSSLQVKAKAVRKHVDKMITLAKRGDLHARRQVCCLPMTIAAHETHPKAISHEI